MCYVLHVHKPLVFIHDIFIIVTRLVWCLFVCLFVYFVSGVIYVLVLYAWIWTLTTQLQTHPSLNSYKVLGIDSQKTICWQFLLENKGTLTQLVIETYCSVLPARACITVVLCIT